MLGHEVKIHRHVLLVDGAHMLRRNMYVPALRELTNSTGVVTGPTYGFLQSLLSSYTTMEATNLIVCWEGGHSKRRLEIYPDYKKREDQDTPEAEEDYEIYKSSLRFIETVLESLGVKQLRVLGKEGDDVLYECTELLNCKMTLVSDDKDFYSLLDRVDIWRPVAQEHRVREFFTETEGYRSPKHYLYAKAILGDGSDNIPQLAKGVGAKTVLTVLDKIDEKDLSITRILEEARSFSPARYVKLANADPSLFERNLDLVDISREEFTDDEISEIKGTLLTKGVSDLDKYNDIMRFLEITTDLRETLKVVLPQSSYFDESLLERS